MRKAANKRSTQRSEVERKGSSSLVAESPATAPHQMSGLRVGPTERDILIDRVQRGELTPVEAERIASMAGMGPFARKADLRHFDSMAETWWTLPMTLAWIVWRSTDQVHEQWDAYRNQCWMWLACRWSEGPEAPIHEGFDLVRYPPATWALFALATSLDASSAAGLAVECSASEARAQLWAALGDGAIEGHATDLESGRTVVIPAEVWKDLTIYQDHDGDVLRTNGLTKAGFGNLRFRARSIVGAWRRRPPATERLPETMKPAGAGYMPLYCAVQWIATRGGSVAVGFSDTLVWDDAYDQLLSHIASDEVSVTGTYKGESQKAGGALFAGIAVEHLFGPERWDLRTSTELYLRSYPYADDEHWRHGFDDSLANRWEAKWTKLMVRKADVARWWPFDLPDDEPKPTGLPGRRSSAHLFMDEFECRLERGEAKPTLTEEARELLSWLRRTHPNAEPPTVKTICNRLRSRHRQSFPSARK